MFTKYSVSFLLVCLFIKQNGGAEVISPRAIIDLPTQVNQAKINFINQAQRAAADANAKALQLSGQITKCGEDRYKDAQKSLNALYEKNRNDLTLKVTQSGGLINKITLCGQKYEAELQQFGVAAFQNITGCVTEKINRGIQLVQNIVGASVTIANSTANLPNRLDKECPLLKDTPLDRIGQLLCFLRVIGAAGVELSAQGVVISVNVAEAVALIASLSTIQVDLPACLVARSVSAAVRFLQVITPIVTCTLTP